MTTLSVTRCDNELYVTAFANGTGSLEVLHISSGYNDPVNYTVNLGSILAAGTYSITMVGINWGGPAAFTVAIDGTPYKFEKSDAPSGVVWTQTITVSVRR